MTFRTNTALRLLTTTLAAGTLFGALTAGAAELEKIRPVPEKIRILPDEPVDIEIWTDRGEGAAYCVGDPIEIYFRTNVDAYVAIFDTDTTGRTHRLFPNRWDSDHYVEGGRVYRLPLGGYSFEIEGPAGRETLRAVAALDPRDLRRAGKLPASYTPARHADPRHHRHDKIAVVPHDVAIDTVSHRVRAGRRCHYRPTRPWWRR